MENEILITGIVSGAAGIVGAVAGFCADRWMRAKGGERVYVSDWRLQYLARGPAGGTPKEVPPPDAEFVHFYFTADIFNTSLEPTGLREVCVEFVANGKRRLSITPGDADSLKVEPMREDIAEVQVINLAPRHWRHLHLRRNVWGDDVKNVLAAEQVFLAATDPDGKRHRFLVAELPRKTLAFAGR
ncbi:MAG TPA: hypothetical protein VGI81_12090 [Tepidisphaeraceae bacterium]|jgi:hypothetical protein